MRTINSLAEMADYRTTIRRAGCLGLVPTMGAFHEGHLSLIRRAREDCAVVVVSLFVNPTQFGPGEDFERYPRDPEADNNLAARVGVDVLFRPPSSEIYPAPYRTYVEVEEITDRLCGPHRPGHFRGVATVVLKLLNIVRPDAAYFGEKDFQQLVVVRQMVRDLNLPVDIVGMPTVRDIDGLALSSRNAYLSPQERKAALVVPRALKLAQQLVSQGETGAKRLETRMRALIASEGLVTLEYFSICRPDDFTAVEEIKGRTLIALAARVGGTRLIDNVVLGDDQDD